MNTLLLTGLDGRNPLGLLAAIGLLRVLDDDARRRKVALPTLSFDPGTAIARVTSDLALDAIIECVLADAAAQGDNRALQFAYTKDGVEATPASPDAIRDLKPPPGLAAKLLRDVASAPERVSGLAAAWFSELVQGKTNDNTKPTAFHFMAGNQTFLGMVNKLRTGITHEDVREALLGPWLNASPLPSLRWDSSVTRLYALRARAPGPDKQGSVPAASWLGVIALEAFPVVPLGGELVTTGVEGGWKTSVFRWPLWVAEATFRTVCSLLRVDARTWTIVGRKALGITEVLGSKIVRDDYASFSPAHVELPPRTRSPRSRALWLRESDPHRRRCDFAAYVDLEKNSKVKHEFLNGVVRAMAGGSPAHSGIAASITRLLGSQLEGRRCRVFNSDLRIRVKATGLATYPDVTVVCGQLEFDPDDVSGHTVTNPKVIVEVLSPSTEAYDRGEKFEHYRQIPSLETVLLVAHDSRCVEAWTRSDDGWSKSIYGARTIVEVSPIDCRLEVDTLYLDPLA